jgi:hypothetical protein
VNWHRGPAVAAIVALSACSSSQAGIPPGMGSVGRTLAGTKSATRPLARTSWMRSGATQREALLYVSNLGTAGVTIYSYQSGSTPQLEGELFGFQSPLGECVDAKGNVFVTDAGAAVIKEYAHGAITPTATIADVQGMPYGCSVNVKTGSLAVSNVYGPTGSTPGNVIIYPKPSGAPAEYSDPQLNEPLFCGFDKKGNLYVDAYDSHSAGVLAVLPSGAENFTVLDVQGGTIAEPSGVQADGKQLLVGNLFYPAAIYQMTISGSTATIDNTISFPNGSTLGQFTKQGSASAATVVVPDNDNSNVKVYSFPSGSLMSTITDGVSQPVSAVISEK